jgi:hypothetical protein
MGISLAPNSPLIQVEQCAVGFSEADRANLAVLARSAAEVDGQTLQYELDCATFAPYGVAVLLRGDRPPNYSPEMWRALSASHTLVKSNIIYRLHPTDLGGELLREDQVLAARRRAWDHLPADRDLYRQMGAALLWGVARLAVNLSVKRDIAKS